MRFTGFCKFLGAETRKGLKIRLKRFMSLESVRVWILCAVMWTLSLTSAILVLSLIRI